MTEFEKLSGSEIEEKGAKINCENCGHEFFKIRGLFVDKEGTLTNIASLDTVTVLMVVICIKCKNYNVNPGDVTKEYLERLLREH